jgi:GNAT superfamily N-acetyltransferase
VIRGATAADYPTFAELFRELSIEETPPSRDRWASELVRDTLISERGGRVDGYVTFIALSEAGHVRNLVVAQHARNDGVGRELMQAAADALRARGIAEWHLNVRVGNTPAIHLYEQLGMAVEHQSVVLRVPVARIPELPRERAQALPVDPVEDDDIERALDLLAGRIAMTRVRSNRVLMQLRDNRCEPIGFASIGLGTPGDPTLPAVSPFRVARPTLAGTLLTALAAHTMSPKIQVVIEDDAGVTRLLAAAGAETALELLHYRGALS